MSSRIITKQDILKAAIPVEAPERGIYFLLSFGQVVYVGQSENCRNRITQHKAEKDFGAYAVEAAHVAPYLPLLNVRMPQASGLVSVSQLMLQKILGRLQLQGRSTLSPVNPVSMGTGVFYRWLEIEAALEGERA